MAAKKQRPAVDSQGTENKTGRKAPKVDPLAGVLSSPLPMFRRVEPAAPVSYMDPELLDAVCAATAAGMTLSDACREHGTNLAELKRYTDTDDAALGQVQNAQRLLADVLFDSLLSIANEPCLEAVEVSHAKLRIETTKYVIGKLNPDKYCLRPGDISPDTANNIQINMDMTGSKQDPLTRPSHANYPSDHVSNPTQG